MNRATRRHLERRGDRAFERARGNIFTSDPANDVALVREDGSIRVLDADVAPHALAVLGLASMAAEIAETRSRYPSHWIPVVVIVAGFASCAMTETRTLTAGGVA